MSSLLEKVPCYFHSVQFCKFDENLKRRYMENDNFLAGRKILIAEDDQNSFFLLEYILCEHGAKIIHTETGEDTIKALVDNPDVCLILMDVRMPGMNGLESARKIRKFNATIPIIAQTALMLTDEKNKIMEVGCNDYFTKPIDQELLLGKIKQLLN